MSTTEKRAVKFLLAWRGYSAGEIAGFDEKVAVQLVKSKVAEEYAAEGEKIAPVPNKPPATRQQASNKRGKTDTPTPGPAGGADGSAGGPADPEGGPAAPGGADGGDGSQAGGADGGAGASGDGSADNDDRP